MLRGLNAGIGLALAVSLVGTVAWAAEIAGKVDKVQRDQGRIVLADGTELWLVRIRPVNRTFRWKPGPRKMFAKVPSPEVTYGELEVSACGDYGGVPGDAPPGVLASAG